MQILSDSKKKSSDYKITRSNNCYANMKMDMYYQEINVGMSPLLLFEAQLHVINNNDESLLDSHICRSVTMPKAQLQLINNNDESLLDSNICRNVTMPEAQLHLTTNNDESPLDSNICQNVTMSEAQLHLTNNNDESLPNSYSQST